MSRSARVERETAESKVTVEIDLDGTGRAEVATGVGFYDHMLSSFARHALFDLTVSTAGDLHVDAHHTVEDTAIALGEALRSALGDKTGIRRFGDALVPLDETLCQVAVDLSGRPYLVHTEPEINFFMIGRIRGHNEGGRFPNLVSRDPDTVLWAKPTSHFHGLEVKFFREARFGELVIR